MLDFRLRVFQTVARKLSFTKAANELYISQPAVTRHVRELEQELGLRLFERRGNSIVLTPAGTLLLAHADAVEGLWRDTAFKLSTLKNQLAGTLRLGASTTNAQYVLPPVLARYHRQFPDVTVSMINGNTEQIEQSLLHKQIDLGLIEGAGRNPELTYTEFLADEIVAVVNTKSTLAKHDELTLDQLKTIPLLLREAGSGTLEIIQRTLQERHIRLSDLTIAMHLGSTESIKTYLDHADCIAFLSLSSVLKEIQAGWLKVIDIPEIDMTRAFCFIQPVGPIDELSASFLRFTRHFYNK